MYPHYVCIQCHVTRMGIIIPTAYNCPPLLNANHGGLYNSTSNTDPGQTVSNEISIAVNIIKVNSSNTSTAAV